MASRSLNGFGLAVVGAGVLLVWSAWRNWTIADTVRAAAALARGDSIPPAGETYGAMAFAMGGKLNSIGQDGHIQGRRSPGTASQTNSRSRARNAAPGSRITERRPI